MSKNHLPLIIMVLASASLFMIDRVNELVTNVAICINFAAVIPLLGL